MTQVTDVSETLRWMIEVIKNDATVRDMVDGEVYAETPRNDVALNLPHHTRLGIDHIKEQSDVYFFSKIRGYNGLNVTMQITILSAEGENNNYCHGVVDAIGNLFDINHSYVTDTYRIHINNIATDVQPSEKSERWVGLVTIEIVQYTAVTPDMI
jgi:hypothetical protein